MVLQKPNLTLHTKAETLQTKSRSGCLVGHFTWKWTGYYYRRHCAQRNAPVFKLLRGRFWGFCPAGV